MSFLQIIDPNERAERVAEYLATVKKLQHRDRTDRLNDQKSREDRTRMFEPVIESADKTASAVTRELIPIQQELKKLNTRIAPVLHTPEPPAPVVKPEEPEYNVWDEYMHKFAETKFLDRYFRIQRTDDGSYHLGTKIVHIVNGTDIVVDETTYPGTTGLWALIMMNDPKDYTSDDLHMYRDLVHQTGVMTHPHNVTAGSRYKQTKKWTHIFP